VALLTSRLERDGAFAAREQRMEELVAELRERTAAVAAGGGGALAGTVATTAGGWSGGVGITCAAVTTSVDSR